MTLPNGHSELNKTLLDISVNDFFELFLKSHSQYSLESYFGDRGEKKISGSEWLDTVSEEFKDCFGMKPL